MSSGRANVIAVGDKIMDIKKDKREWDIVIVKDNSKCDFLSYPANYHACNHPYVEHPGETECNMDTCPVELNNVMRCLFSSRDRTK